MAKSSSIPKKVDFPIKQGDTFRRVFRFSIDVSSATFKFIIDGEPDLTIGNGLTISGVENTDVIVSKDITWSGTKKYEFERVMNGITWTPFEGKMISEIELDENE